MVNIVEKYIELNKQFIILISGLPGCGKQELGQNISRDFGFKLLDTYDYYKKNYNETVMLEDVSVINYYTDDAIDWDDLLKEVSKHKKGVIIVGMSLPKDKFNADFHIHLNISKQISLDKLREYVVLHKDKFPEEFKIVDTPIEKLKMNKLIYPYYLESTKNEKINKYISVKEMNYDEVYDIAFEVLMQFVQKYLDDNVKLKSNNDNKLKNNNSNNITLEMLDEPRYTYDEELDMIKKLEADNDNTDDSNDTDETEQTTEENTEEITKDNRN